MWRTGQDCILYSDNCGSQPILNTYRGRTGHRGRELARGYLALAVGRIARDFRHADRQLVRTSGKARDDDPSDVLASDYGRGEARGQLVCGRDEGGGTRDARCAASRPVMRSAAARLAARLAEVLDDLAQALGGVVADVTDAVVEVNACARSLDALGAAIVVMVVMVLMDVMDVMTVMAVRGEGASAAHVESTAVADEADGRGSGLRRRGQFLQIARRSRAAGRLWHQAWLRDTAR